MIPEADGFTAIPNVAKAPSAKRTCRASYNATLGARHPDQLLPALNHAGSELNALAAVHIPRSHAKFAVVFHGDAIDGILDDARYRAKFNVPNPNLEMLSEMRAAGAERFACGQNLAAVRVDPADIPKDVTVAGGALSVRMAYENDGYALPSFSGRRAGAGVSSSTRRWSGVRPGERGSYPAPGSPAPSLRDSTRPRWMRKSVVK